VTLLMLCLASILLRRPYVVWVYSMYAVKGGFIIGLGSLCCQFHGLSYLLRAVSIVLEDGGEKLQFLCEGVFITECFGSVYQGSED
jgi:hypothetical protein